MVSTYGKKSTEKELRNLSKKIGKVPKFFEELMDKEPEMFNLVMRFNNISGMMARSRGRPRS